MRYVLGIDLGGTKINYAVLDENGDIFSGELIEHPARAVEGPKICLEQIVGGLDLALRRAGVSLHEVAAIGLDTPGPASARGVLSARGSTNFAHPDWAGFDMRGAVEERLQRPTVYINDANAAALWGHVSLFGPNAGRSSVSVIIGTGCGGGVILNDQVVEGRNGFGGELGHILIPYQQIEELAGLQPLCNCGRTGDLESLCSLTSIRRNTLPHFLRQSPGHPLAQISDPAQAAYQVRPMAEAGDPLCRAIFRTQAQALGLLFDEMINAFDPDALIVGGGVMETGEEFRTWFLSEVRKAMPSQREEQAGIPLHRIPNGDCAGALGAAVQALQSLR